MRTTAIIQARTGSNRLPGKILKILGTDTVIAQMYARVLQTRGLDQVVIAMPDGVGDDALADHVASFCPTIFRGSENDVLARYAGAAAAYPSDQIVRITSDCPFFDPDILSDMLIAFNQQRPDYMTNTWEPHLPRGLDAEVFTIQALQTATIEATAPHTREHVTPFIYQNTGRFDVASYRATEADHADLRWTLDTAEDWSLIKTMYDMLTVPFQQARLADFLKLYETRPDLRIINATIKQKTLEV